MISVHDDRAVDAVGDLAAFRVAFYRGLSRRADALFELSDAVLCTEGPVRNLVELSLAAPHRRGHGSLYDGLNHGRMEVQRLRTALAGLPLPRSAEGRLMLAVDVSPWLRPDANTSPDRLFCHVYGRGKGQAQMIPGWPYSFVAALEPGRTSWTAVLDAVRLGPHDDVAEVTATQLRAVIGRLIEAGQWQPGNADILIVCDAGYDLARLAYLLADLPVEVLGRLRSDRVLRLPTPPRPPGTLGRPRRHGGEFDLDEPATWPQPQHTTTCDTTRYGTATAQAWDRLHPRLTRRAAWLEHTGDLPVLEGTLIRLTVQHLPGDRNPQPIWLGKQEPSVPGSLPEAAQEAALPRQRGRRRRRASALVGDGLVVVGPRDRVDDLLVGEVLRIRDVRHEADEYPVAHDLGLQPGRPVGVPDRVTAVGQGDAHTELGDAGPLHVGGHPPLPQGVHYSQSLVLLHVPEGSSHRVSVAAYER